MTRQEFLHELQIALQGEMSREAVEGHVRYYGDYIMEESRKGASEEEVVARLGSPRLIAKTLIDTTEQFGPSFRGRMAGAGTAGMRTAEEASVQDIPSGAAGMSVWGNGS